MPLVEQWRASCSRGQSGSGRRRIAGRHAASIHRHDSWLGFQHAARRNEQLRAFALRRGDLRQQRERRQFNARGRHGHDRFGGTAYAWGGNNFSTAATTEALAISASDYCTFSLTVQSGYSLSLTSIAAYNIRHSGTGPTTGIWGYEIGSGGFTDIGSAITWGSTTTSAGNTEPAITLPAALQSLTAGTTVTFRVVTSGRDRYRRHVVFQ